ncbi:hypothetical protein ASPWEDRAFT_716179 [Aspergillus wentii DTO 134E9]|uniref:Uncharacterized protein n=1 Tax=Aspergillus wentii DTO 134E9 TaxID=1073089 RepID=A0A1L9R6I7_ASPWE|nr:uncharacterized protein ASPWEDRAFT_716179 [Aspergillus wentii DTO 134E9]OJJ30497.1 hypothetical protein ASPWEDRAFT_716179 [Aspergillus wentii DTO 134E9]
MSWQALSLKTLQRLTVRILLLNHPREKWSNAASSHPRKVGDVRFLCLLSLICLFVSACNLVFTRSEWLILSWYFNYAVWLVTWLVYSCGTFFIASRAARNPVCWTSVKLHI